MKAFRIFYLITVIGLCTVAASAQESASSEPETADPGPFYGFWELDEPAGDSCVVIIKRGGRLSCFWTGNSSREIQKGSWERNKDRLTATWETGHVDVFRKLGENAIVRHSYQPDMSLDEEPVLTVRGVRVNQQEPGALTVPVDPEEDTAPPSTADRSPDKESDLPAVALPVRNTFLGFYKVPQSTGIFGIGGAGEPHFYLHLNRNGEASVALRDWKAGSGDVGNWTVNEGRAVVTWPGGRRDVLIPGDEEDAFTLEFYNRKREFSDKPNYSRRARRVDATEAGRYFQAGNIKRLTVVDIRGTWRPLKPTGNGEYIDIEGWGNAYRYPAADGTGTDPGKWRLKSDRVVITWIDGSKDVIRMGTPDMIQESYPPDVPLTAAPERVIAVRRTNGNPL